MPAHVPKRRFGQHFLRDPAAIRRIVDAIAPAADDRLIEIGPGLGALTGPLLDRVNRLHVVEIDRDVIARLRTGFPPDRLVIHEGDALEFDFAALGPGLRVVGNLPYNISSPLLFRVATARRAVLDCHFMLQKEVVDRMAAAPGSSEYGRLSVALQYCFGIQKLFEVPPGAFEPPPKVRSAVVRMTPLDPIPAPAVDERLFGTLVTRAFTQRRKMLRNALSPFLLPAEMERLGLDPRARPETLSVADYVRAANHVAARGVTPPASSG